MKNAKKMIALAVAISMAALAGCAATSEQAATPKAANDLGTLKVGSVLSFAPLSMTVDNKATGFDVELVEELAHKIGYSDVEWVVSDFAGLIPSVASHKIDMADNTTGWAAKGTTAYDVVKKRTEQVSFSRPWFLQTAMLISTKKGLTNVDQLKKGMKVAVEDKTQYFIWAQQELAPKGIELVPGPQTGLYTQLDAGIVDAVIDGTTNSSEALKKFPDIRVGDPIPATAGGFCFVLAPDNTKLLTALNKSLGEFIDDGGYAKLYKKYFPGLKVPTLPTTSFVFGS